MFIKFNLQPGVVSQDNIYLCSVISEVMEGSHHRQLRLRPPGLEDFLLNCHCLALTLATSRRQKQTLISSQE